MSEVECDKLRIYSSELGKLSSGNYDIKRGVLEEVVAKIKIDSLRDVGETFLKNIRVSDHLCTLPIVTCAMTIAEYHKLPWEIKARLQSRVMHPEKADEEQISRYKEAWTKIIKEEIEPSKEESITKIIDEGEERFKVMLKESGLVYEPYEALLYSSIVWLWCSLEVFVKDVWEMALNMGGQRVIKNTLKGIDKLTVGKGERTLTGKYVSLEYLAKFDFNISGKLGIILSDKFDFSSLFGIKEAYLCAFPRSQRIRDAVDSRILLELEAKRNVIAHRAGIIDDLYCKKLGLSRKEIGHKLEVSNMDICNYGNWLVNIAVPILKAVSDIVSSDEVV